jgi:hypothetical protein
VTSRADGLTRSSAYSTGSDAQRNCIRGPCRRRVVTVTLTKARKDVPKAYAMPRFAQPIPAYPKECECASPILV